MTADLNRGGFCVDATERCERQLTAIIKTHKVLQMGRKAEGIEKGAIVPSAVIAALSYAVQDGRRKRRGSRCPPRRRGIADAHRPTRAARLAGSTPSARHEAAFCGDRRCGRRERARDRGHRSRTARLGPQRRDHGCGEHRRCHQFGRHKLACHVRRVGHRQHRIVRHADGEQRCVKLELQRQPFGIIIGLLVFQRG